MTVEQYQALYSFSVAEVISKSFKNFQSDNIKDYIDKSISNILKFGLEKNRSPKVLRNAIYAVRKQITFMVAEKQLANNPDDLTNMHTQDAGDVKEFLNNPVDYINTKLKDDEYYNKVKPKNIEGLNENDNAKYSRDLDEARNRLTEYLSAEAFKVRYNGTENKKTYAKDVHDQITKKLGNSTIQNELHSCRPGFWEKIRGKTSIQYKTFKSAMEGYTDKNNPDIGDREALETAAINYLHHKFPRLREGELPTLDEINRLGSKSKKRATLCLKVALSCREVKQAIKLTDAVRGLNLNANNVAKENEINNNIINNELQKENSNEIKVEAKPKKSSLKSAFANKDKPKKKVGFSKTNIVGSPIKPKDDEEVLEAKEALKEPTEVIEEALDIKEVLKKPTMVFEEVQVDKDPKRYVNAKGKLVGGNAYKAKHPANRKVYWGEDHSPESKAIKEEEKLKNESLMDDQKKIAPDNNEFINKLKDEVEDMVVDNNNVIDSKDNNIEVDKNGIEP